MKNVRPLILAIESSCDDTAAAVLSGGNILSNIVSSQLDHARYGGVIPELASRKHEELILDVIDMACKEAKITLSNLDAVAVTSGPGLMGSLLVGMSVAKSISMACSIPIIEVNHMQAHILAHFIEPPLPAFPFLCLTVSGGHTQLVRVNGPLYMEILGQTLDDAAGEAFDKIGKMLGLPYPSGPQIDRLAAEGNPVFTFPVTRLDQFQFSFSGLKTAILYFLKKEMKTNPRFIEQNLANIAASVQKAIVDNLMLPLSQAAQETGINRLAISGGVSANSHLRARLKEVAASLQGQAFIPSFQYCTDNAGMIAMAAHYLYQEAMFARIDMAPKNRWSF
jgi:N6-L-threonylcarbamoyladenine synthase